MRMDTVDTSNHQHITKSTVIGGKNNQYLVNDFIGKGTFSRCYTLKSCVSGKLYAGKCIKKATLQQFQIWNRVSDEIKIHRSLKHKNIVGFKHFFVDKDYIYIILELCSNYSLDQMLKKRKYLCTFEAKYFMLQISSAVEYLHSIHIMHRDLKLGNLFIDKYMCVKVGDFGLAAYIEFNRHKRYTMCGTPNYLSPEVISRKGHSLAVDIWALGCILYTLLVGHPPFETLDTKATYMKILKCEFTLPADMRTSAKTFIINTLQINPENRPNISSLLTYEFLTSGLIPTTLPTSSLTLAPDKPITNKNQLQNLPPKQAASQLGSKKHFGKVSNLGHQLQKLKYLLEDLSTWKVSNEAEMEAESSSLSPLVWINSWVDYSKLYGFVYRLNDDNVGVLFNDHSTMVIAPTGEMLFYIDDDGFSSYFTPDNITNKLKKKYSILLHCRQYIFDSLRSAYDSSNDSESLNSVPLLMDWQRFESCILMVLSNGILQINFLLDHTKLILCPIMETVTVIDNSNNFKTIEFNALKTHGCSVDFMKRLSLVRFKINNFVK